MNNFVLDHWKWTEAIFREALQDIRLYEGVKSQRLQRKSAVEECEIGVPVPVAKGWMPQLHEQQHILLKVFHLLLQLSYNRQCPLYPVKLPPQPQEQLFPLLVSDDFIIDLSEVVIVGDS